MIEFNFLKTATLRNRTKLRHFLALMCKKEGYSLKALSVVFCSDDSLLEVNRTHLQHDYYTDIITFNYSTQEKVVDAELLISIDRVNDNAKTFSSSKERELHRVIFHGVLHLVGYNDKSPRDIRRMREKEDHYLNLYFK